MLKKLIIVDDDAPFRERLARSMAKKAFLVETFADLSKMRSRISLIRSLVSSGVDILRPVIFY